MSASVRSSQLPIVTLAGADYVIIYDVSTARLRRALVTDFQALAPDNWGSITGTLSDQTDLAAALDAKAPLASPALTGAPTAPTAVLGTNTTQIANTAFATAAVASLAATVTAALAAKAPTTRTLTAAGLVTGGGDLSADRILSVASASQAEAEAGTATAVAMTPQRTAQAIAALADQGFVGTGTLTKIVPAVPPTSPQPASQFFSFNITGFTSTWTITVDGTPFSVIFNPAAGVGDVDTSNSPDVIASILVGFLQAQHSGVIVASTPGDGTFNLLTQTIGGTASLQTSPEADISGSGATTYGADGIAGTPETGTRFAIVVPAVAGKTHLPMLAACRTGTAPFSVPVEFGYWNGITFSIIAQRSPSTGDYTFSLLDEAGLTSAGEAGGFTALLSPSVGLSLAVRTGSDEPSGDDLLIAVSGITI